MKRRKDDPGFSGLKNSVPYPPDASELRNVDIETGLGRSDQVPMRWRGETDVEIKHSWKNLKVMRLRHSNRDSFVKSNPLNFVFVYKGKPSQQHIRVGGKNIFNLQRPGLISVAPAYQEYESWYDEVLQDDLYLVIHNDFLKGVAESINLDPGKVELIATFGRRNRQIEELSRLAYEEVRNGIVGGNLYGDSLATALTVHLLWEYSNITPGTQPRNRGLAPTTLNRILDLIETNLGEDLSLSTLASAAGLSNFYFLRLFKHSTKLSPHQYVIRRRLEKAKHMLSTGKLSITEISYKLGFSTPSHFSVTFRRHFGVSPSEYRRDTT